MRDIMLCVKNEWKENESVSVSQLENCTRIEEGWKDRENSA